jgi:hypothetical protein
LGYAELYSYDLQGNVSTSSDRSSTIVNEAFSYDTLQRLLSSTRNGTAEPMTYYNTGNIKSKYNLGSEQYFYDRFAPSSCSSFAGSRAARQAGKYLPAGTKVLSNAIKVLGSAVFTGFTLMIHTDSASAMTRLADECPACQRNISSFEYNNK